MDLVLNRITVGYRKEEALKKAKIIANCSGGGERVVGRAGAAAATLRSITTTIMVMVLTAAPVAAAALHQMGPAPPDHTPRD